MTTPRVWRHPSRIGRRMTVMYSLWCNMKARCGNPKHPAWNYYGARGVTVCKRWLHDFDAFCDDVGPHPGIGLTFDRRNNNGHYKPNNVRWATRNEQAQNKTNTRLSMRSIRAATKMRASGVVYQDIANKLGVNVTTIHRALTGVTWTNQE